MHSEQLYFHIYFDYEYDTWLGPDFQLPGGGSWGEITGPGAEPGSWTGCPEAAESFQGAEIPAGG